MFSEVQKEIKINRMALTRQQKRFTKRLIEDTSKLDFIADKQGMARLKDWDVKRSEKLARQSELFICVLTIGLSLCFLFNG